MKAILIVKDSKEDDIRQKLGPGWEVKTAFGGIYAVGMDDWGTYQEALWAAAAAENCLYKAGVRVVIGAA